LQEQLNSIQDEMRQQLNLSKRSPNGQGDSDGEWTPEKGILIRVDRLEQKKHVATSTSASTASNSVNSVAPGLSVQPTAPRSIVTALVV